MVDSTDKNGTSGSIETTEASVNTTSKTKKTRAKALEVADCEVCKKYGWDKETLDNKIKEMSKTFSKNQVASMLRVHSQYVDEVMSK